MYPFRSKCYGIKRLRMPVDSVLKVGFSSVLINNQLWNSLILFFIFSFEALKAEQIYYQIVNVSSGYSLDVSGAATTNTAPIIQSVSNSATSQQWELIDKGLYCTRLRNRNSGLAMGISGVSIADGTAVVQAMETDSTNQLWHLDPMGASGYFKLRNAQSGKVLQLSGQSLSTGAATVQMTDNGSYGQLWSFTRVPSGSPAPTSGPNVFSVAKWGNDANPGTLASPFLTLARAALTLKAGQTCYVRAGVYRETLAPAKSGTSTSPITYQAYPDETVIISGMNGVSGWGVYRGNIYTNRISLTLGDQNLVCFNSKPMTLARWPNITDENPFSPNSAPIYIGSLSNIQNAEIPTINWTNAVVWCLAGDRWNSWRTHVTSSDASTHTVSFPANTNWDYTYMDPAMDVSALMNPGTKNEFYLMNKLAALDVPGEWYYESTNSTLYFQAPGNVTPDAGLAEVRQRTTAINLNSRSYVDIIGINCFGANIDLTSANSCHLQDLRVKLGATGIDSSTASGAPGGAAITISGNSNQITRCEVAYGSDYGIFINAGSGNLISQCRLHDFNWVANYATIVKIQGSSNTLTQCEIFHAGRQAIIPSGSGCDISYNDVHDGTLLCNDTGLLYTFGVDGGGTRIHHNWFHSAHSRSGDMSSGVYLDNGCSNWTIDHNVVSDVDDLAYFVNTPAANINVFNNTAWFLGANGAMATDPQLFYTNVLAYNNIANSGLWNGTATGNNMITSDSPFVNATNGDYRLLTNTPPVNAGLLIPGYTDGYSGTAPDIGAYELGRTNWVAGIGGALDDIIWLSSAFQTNIVKANNLNNLDLSSSWTNGPVRSGSIAVWNQLVTTANTTTIGGGIALGGIFLNSPGAAVTINPGTGGLLSLGQYGIDASQTAYGLTLNAPVFLNGDQAWNSGSTSLTAGGSINGGGGLTKCGSGVLTLAGANTYSGDSAVNAGILVLSNSLALQNSPLDTDTSCLGSSTQGITLAVTSLKLGGLSGTKDLGTLFTTGGGYSGVTALTLNPGNGISSVYSGSISNGAAGMMLFKTGTGAQTLSGTNWYTGATIVSAGTLTMGGSGNLGGGNYAANLTNNGVFNYAASGSQNLSGVISGNGPVLISGPGTLTLSGTNTYSGGTFLNGGTLSVSTNSALGTGLLTLFGGTFSNSASCTLTGAVNLTASAAVGVRSGCILSLVGNLTNTGSLTHSGPGTLVLSGTNTYCGDTTVIGGALSLNAGSIGTSNSTLTVAGMASSSIFNLGAATATFDSLYVGYNADAAAGSVNQTAGTMNLVTTFQVGQSWSSQINIYTLSGGTINANTVEMELGRANSYSAYRQTGGTANMLGILFNGPNHLNAVTLSGGIINIGSNGIHTNGGANYDLNYSGATVGSLAAWTSSLNAELTNSTIFDTTGGSIGLAGVLSSIGGIVKSGTGTLTLSGANTYKGITTVSNGTLQVTGAIGTNLVRVISGATLGGTGVLGGTVTNNGTLAPAMGGIGTLGINGKLAFGPAGQALMGIQLGPFTNDLVLVGGSATYNGTLLVSNTGGGTLTNGMVFHLFSVAGAKNGNFTNVVLPSTNSLVGIFNPTNGNLTLAAIPTLTLRAGTLAYGQPLASASLSGCVATNGINGALVPGRFDFANPAMVPKAGETNVWVVFTPTDTTNYLTTSNTVTVNVGSQTNACRIINLLRTANSLTLIGTNNNGYSSGYFQILSTTNLSFQLTNWSVIYSNSFNPDGSCIYTNTDSISTPMRFFILKQ